MQYPHRIYTPTERGAIRRMLRGLAFPEKLETLNINPCDLPDWGGKAPTHNRPKKIKDYYGNVYVTSTD